MKLNKKGFTLIELIVSIALLSIVMVFMVNLFMEARIMFNDSRSITVFESDKRYIIKSLSTDLEDNTINKVTKTGNRLDFEFKELGETKTLEIQQNENGKTYLFYGCKASCNNADKSITTYKKLIPDGSTIGNIEFEEATESSKLGSIKISIIIAGKDESLNVFYSYKEVDSYESYFFADALLNSVNDADVSPTEVINKGTGDNGACTKTFMFDGTEDNNLRFVGANPCNYVLFNGETPAVTKKWAVYSIYEGEESRLTINDYDSESECISVKEFFDSYGGTHICKSWWAPSSGWRIMGVMNNVDNGFGTKETRIKLVKATEIGEYSWDSSTSTSKPEPQNDWSTSDLMKQLNGDFLNSSLTSNTKWYASTNNQNIDFDYRYALKASAQSLISNAKWYLGGKNYREYDYTVEESYISERSTDVFTGHTTSWVGRVALPYPSDYVYATDTTNRSHCLSEMLRVGYPDYDHTCVENNWFSNMAFITSKANSSSDIFLKYYISETSPFIDNNVKWETDVVPSVYLRSDVIITGGDGSIENPYTIGLDEE